MRKSIKSIGICLSLCLLANAPIYGLFKFHPEEPQRFAGDILQIAIPLTGAIVAATQKDTEGLTQLAKSQLVNAVTTEAIKISFNHTQLGRRPNGGNKSFPSGHTSAACAGATFIGQRYGWKTGVFAMGLAGYVGYTRVYAKAHHVRDVLVGCAIGTLTGLIMTNPKDGTQVMPWYENKTLGISISSQW